MIYKIALVLACIAIAALGTFGGEIGEIIILYCPPIPAIVVFIAYKAFEGEM